MGIFKSCKTCASGKAKKANLSKLPDRRATKFGERLFIVIVSSMAVSHGRKKHWLLLVMVETAHGLIFIVAT